MQLPPAINQAARVNADYLLSNGVGADLATPWRPVEDWESPVLGWFVMNFANQSLQVFSQTGDFVREYRVQDGQILTRLFPAHQLSSTLSPQMPNLLSKIDACPNYLSSVVTTLSTAAESIEESPTHQAESMASILGRPIALFNFGISLELAE